MAMTGSEFKSYIASEVKKYESLTDGCFREKLVIVVLVACLLFIGVCPGWISEMLDWSIAPIFEKFL